MQEQHLELNLVTSETLSPVAERVGVLCRSMACLTVLEGQAQDNDIVQQAVNPLREAHEKAVDHVAQKLNAAHQSFDNCDAKKTAQVEYLDALRNANAIYDNLEAFPEKVELKDAA